MVEILPVTWSLTLPLSLTELHYWWCSSLRETISVFVKQRLDVKFINYHLVRFFFADLKRLQVYSMLFESVPRYLVILGNRLLVFKQ